MARAVRDSPLGDAAPIPFSRAAGPNIRSAEAQGDLVNFCSNDYLGLARHPAVAAALGDAAAAEGVGACSSRLLAGYHPWHREAEARVAAFVGAEAAVLFACGFLSVQSAISGFFAGLPEGAHARILIDAASHVAARDAAARCGVAVTAYPHTDVAALGRTLAAGAGTPCLIVTDGIFSATGTIAPLPALSALARRHGAALLVDDAHGIGALGRQGGGALELTGLGVADVDLLLGTCSKALGSFGGFLAGRVATVARVAGAAVAYGASTAPPACLAAATAKSLEIAAAEPWRRERLAERVAQFRALALAAGLAIGPSPTMIQTVRVPASDVARLVAALASDGIFLRVLPGAPPGIVRISLTATHEPTHIEGLVAALARHGAATGTRP